jgi:hypothetical protein
LAGGIGTVEDDLLDFAGEQVNGLALEIGQDNDFIWKG